MRKETEQIVQQREQRHLARVKREQSRAKALEDKMASLKLETLSKRARMIQEQVG